MALADYAFPPASANDVAFVDGWEMHFSELLVTVDHVTLSQNPDLNPGDQSQTGSVVAALDGPWAVDLHKGGPLAGKGGANEQAVPIASLTGQNQNGCAPFDLTQRYAFSFDAVPATASAMNVNLDAQAEVDYAEMIASGYTVLYVGQATFKGSGCTPDDPEFGRLPITVSFRLGFRSPTSYLNCQNPDNDPAKAFAGEEHQRGIYTFGNKHAIAQVTIHTDHPFWDSIVHDSPLHFDQVAARYLGLSGTPTAIVEDFAATDFTHFTDAQGNALPWRSCVGSAFTPPDTGTMHFDPRGVPVNPSDQSGHSLRNYADYMRYNQSTQGHLNSDGLCYVRRNFPSP